MQLPTFQILKKLTPLKLSNLQIFQFRIIEILILALFMPEPEARGIKGSIF